MTKNLFDLSKSTALITGGARGIGYTTAKILGVAGASVIVIDTSETELERAIERLRSEGVIVEGWRCDITNEIDAAATVSRAREFFGPVDILVNNAGVSNHCPPEEMNQGDWQRVLDVNITGTFLMCREVARGLIADQLPGAIVNLSSISGSSSLGRGIFAYGTAKAGIEQLTRELAVEWAQFGIRVNAVAPCQVDTEGFRSVVDKQSTNEDNLIDRVLRAIPLGRLADPADVANAIHFLVSRAAAMITGVVLPVDGGNLAFNAGGTLRPKI